MTGVGVPGRIGAVRTLSIDKRHFNRYLYIDVDRSGAVSEDQSAPPASRAVEPVVYPEVEREHAQRMASIAKALGDPVRLQLVDVLKKHAGKVCVCELVPLFDLSQPTVSHHLKVLRDAGIVGSERAGPVGLLLRAPRGAEGAVRMAELSADIRETVRQRYAAAANAAAGGLMTRRERSDDPGSSAPPSGTGPGPRTRPRPPSPPLLAVVCRPPWLTCTMARSCSTLARAPAPMSSSPRAGSLPPAGQSVWI